MKLNMEVNKNQDGLFYWTKHSQGKLRQYNLSANRVKRLIRHPERIEAGIAPETWASMQTAGSKKHPYEIWTMYVIEKTKGQKSIRIISAWKYPGKTNPGDPIPIPPDIFEEIMISLSKINSNKK
ncbi:MAG: hypothetical protein WC306_00735 [Candidatus Paceibacterota bacterium]